MADSYNHKIKLVTDLAAKTPLCTTCPIEGLNEPGGLAYDGLSTLYIADTNNHCVQKLDIDKFEMEKLILEMPKSGMYIFHKNRIYSVTRLEKSDFFFPGRLI